MSNIHKNFNSRTRVGATVLSLSMKTDTPELPATIAEALATLNLVDIK